MRTEVGSRLYQAVLACVGIGLLACVGGTVLITDSSVPADFQGAQWMWLSVGMMALLAWWLVGCMLDLRVTVRIMSEGTEWVLMTLGAVQALYGLGQVAGLYPSGHSLFVLTGTFYNPGPYSGYLAAVLPVALYRLWAVNGRSDRMARVQYYFSLCVALLIGCVLPAGMSRAAWLAAAVSGGYVAFRVYRVQVRTFVAKYRYLVMAACVGLLVCAVGAYLMKQDSADGRLLIWKVTSRAIAAAPEGEGQGNTFSALYGAAQERYFAEGGYSESEAWVAGTPDFAFNEYLQLAAEQGIWVAVIFVVFLLVLLWVSGRRKQLVGIGGCMVSLMVFACFSYPLHIPALVAVWILTIMVLLGEWLVRVKSARGVKWGLIPVVGVGGMFFMNIYQCNSVRVQAVREWIPSRILYHSGAFQAAAVEYGKLYGKMDWHSDFCFEYGRTLYRLQCYEEAEKVLLQALKVSGDPMILNLLGRNAQGCGEYEKAEQYLIRSTHRLPERIYPYYLLVKLYAEPAYAHKEKLLQAAEYVLYAEPKVNSTAIREMRQEVRGILKEKALSD